MSTFRSFNLCLDSVDFPFRCLIMILTVFRELTLQKGDIVYIHRQVDANWFEGEHHGRAGIFPTTYVEVIFFIWYFSTVLCCCDTVSNLFIRFSQILSPTEKPTPIKSPTLQVLDYGEAVALFNFNADLPVELSFRKVSIAEELQERGEGFPSTLSPFNCLYWC